MYTPAVPLLLQSFAEGTTGILMPRFAVALLLQDVAAGTPRLGTPLAIGAGGASSLTTTLLSQSCRTTPLLAPPLKTC